MKMLDNHTQKINRIKERKAKKKKKIENQGENSKLSADMIVFMSNV